MKKYFAVIVLLLLGGCINATELDKVCQIKNFTKSTDFDLSNWHISGVISYECDNLIIFHDGSNYCNYFSNSCIESDKWGNCIYSEQRIICNKKYIEGENGNNN